MNKEDRIEGLESALDMFKHLERTGIEVCKCNIGYVCGYHKLELVIDDIKTSHKNTAIKVRCINTGMEYESMVEASVDTLVSSSNIGKCCRGQIKSAGKFLNMPRRWEFIK